MPAAYIITFAIHKYNVKLKENRVKIKDNFFDIDICRKIKYNNFSKLYRR